jgi:peptidylprolyl isomerase
MPAIRPSLLAAAIFFSCGIASQTIYAQAAKPAAPATAASPVKAKSMQEILDASQASDWRSLNPETTLYVELASGRVIIELAPQFAPEHSKNIVALAKENYFDGLSINRSQDNFVVQWGNANSDDAAKKRKFKTAKQALPAEFSRKAAGMVFSRLPDKDGWAPQVGFVEGFPAAKDPVANKAWPAHCYGMVGAGRDTAPDSSNGSELYVVIGQSPRQLDRNITVVGRVIQGMELLSILPRGTGPLGFYEKAEQRVAIKSVKIMADVPEAERTALEIFKTDTKAFTAIVEARRNRRDDWYKVPAGHIDLCNVPIPTRLIKKN